VPWPFRIRSGLSIAGDGGVHQSRIPGAQLGTGDAKSRRRRRSEALDHQVRPSDQTIKGGPRRRVAQVQCHTAFATVEQQIVDAAPTNKRRQLPHWIPTARVLDLDDIRAQFGEHQRGVRAWQQAGQVEDAQAAEKRQRRAHAFVRNRLWR